MRRIRDDVTFCRLVVSGEETVLVDLALDAPPQLPPSPSIAGPTFGLEELAGHKLLALFDRAEARDFADVYVLVQRYGTDTLLNRAEEVDPGLDRATLADITGSLVRFDDADLPINADRVTDLRVFFTQWQIELRASDHG